MPEMNGYEVCEALKKKIRCCGIFRYCLFSALTETLDKVRAFQSGGVDYVTKPFQFEEVLRPRADPPGIAAVTTRTADAADANFCCQPENNDRHFIYCPIR